MGYSQGDVVLVPFGNRSLRRRGVENLRRRNARHERDDYHAATLGADKIAADYFGHRVVATFDQHVGF